MKHRASVAGVLIPAMLTVIAAMGQAPANQSKPNPANLPRYKELDSQLNDLEAQKEERFKGLESADPAFAKARSRKPEIDIKQFEARQSYLIKRKELGDASTTRDFRGWEGFRKLLVNSEFNQRFYEEPRNRPMSETVAVAAIEFMRQPGRTLPPRIEQMLPKEDAIDIILRSRSAMVEPNLLESSIKIGEAGAKPQADRIVDGVLTEYFTPSKAFKSGDIEFVSGFLSKNIIDKTKQSGHMVFNLKGQPGITETSLARGFSRAQGAETERLIKSVTFITDNGVINFP